MAVPLLFLGGWYSICRKAKYPARVNSGRAQPVYPGSSPGRNANKWEDDPAIIVVGVDSMAKESKDDDEIVSASCHVHNNEDDDDDDDFVDGTKVLFFHVKDIIIS